MSRSARPTLSPADRARIKMLRQEAEAERRERLIEARLDELRAVREAMEGEAIYRPHVLHDHSDQWERRALQEANCGRPASRLCFHLPPAAYDAGRAARYADGGR